MSRRGRIRTGRGRWRRSSRIDSEDGGRTVPVFGLEVELLLDQHIPAHPVSFREQVAGSADADVARGGDGDDGPVAAVEEFLADDGVAENPAIGIGAGGEVESRGVT